MACGLLIIDLHLHEGEEEAVAEAGDVAQDIAGHADVAAFDRNQLDLNGDLADAGIRQLALVNGGVE